MTALLSAMLAQGCVSVQVNSGHRDRPIVIGFGRTRTLVYERALVHQTIAPGISIRIGPNSPGLSIGWYESKHYFPPAQENQSSSGPVAIENQCVGLDLGLKCLSAGYRRTFAIPLPRQDRNVVQQILFSEESPNAIVVERKEIP